MRCCRASSTRIPMRRWRCCAVAPRTCRSRPGCRTRSRRSSSAGPIRSTCATAPSWPSPRCSAPASPASPTCTSGPRSRPAPRPTCTCAPASGCVVEQSASGWAASAGRVHRKRHGAARPVPRRPAGGDPLRARARRTARGRDAAARAPAGGRTRDPGRDALHESAWEVAQSLARHGQRPLERLQRLGLASPLLVAVHVTQVAGADLDTLAACGAAVVHCPESNLKLGSGIRAGGRTARPRRPRRARHRRRGLEQRPGHDVGDALRRPAVGRRHLAAGRAGRA